MRERSKKYNNFTFENQEDTLIYNKIIEKSEVYIAPRVLIFLSNWKDLSMIVNYKTFKNPWW